MVIAKQIEAPSAAVGNPVVADADGHMTHYANAVFQASGMVMGADNTYDIGQSGALRPRSIYVGTSVIVGAAGTGTISCPGSGSLSEEFGQGATTAGSLGSATAVGGNASAIGLWATALGKGADASGQGAVALGFTTTASATHSTAVGDQASSTHTNSRVFGVGQSTGTNQFVCGADANPVQHVYFGSGAANFPAVAYYIRGTGGVGTNTGGGAVGIAGGKATGNSTVAGSINFYTSDVGVSGSTPQSESLKWQIQGQLGGHILPGSTNSYDIGGTTRRVRTLYGFNLNALTLDSVSSLTIGGTTTTSVSIGRAGQNIGFYGATAVAKPAVTGSRGGNAALANALTALASLGLITDSSTA